MKKTLFLIIFGLILLALGIGLGRYGLAIYQMGVASQSWVDVDAKVEQFGFHSSSGRMGNRKSSAKPTTWINYNYNVGQQNYQGDRVGFGAMPASEIPKIPRRGEVISIKYNPENVFESVWVAGPAFSAKLSIIFSLVLVVTGVALLGGLLVASVRRKN